MTDNPCGCKSCKHYNDETETEYGMCYAEPGHREQMYNNTFDHVSKYGCLSHPQAREWLMKDVIEELEPRKVEEGTP